MRKVIFLILIFISMGLLTLSGCVVSNRLNEVRFEEMKTYIEGINGYEAVELSMVSYASINGATEKAEALVKVIDRAKEQKAYFEMNALGESVFVYYVDGYCYVDDSQTALIDFTDFQNVEDEYLGDTVIGMDALMRYDYKITKANIGEYTEYILKAKGVNSDPIIGVYLGNGDFTLRVRVTTSTNYMAEMSYTMDVDIEGVKIKLSLDIVFKAFGKAVVIDVPVYVLTQIELYKISCEPLPEWEVIPPTEPPAVPAVESYADRADGSVSYREFGSYKKVVYDRQTNKLAVLRESSVDIYDASTFALRDSLVFEINPAAIDCDKGVLAIGFGEERQIHLYDLTDNSEIERIFTQIRSDELVMDGDMIFYNGFGFYSAYYDIQAKTETWLDCRGFFTINRKDHILYLTETGNSSCVLIYFNSLTAEILYKSDGFAYVKERVFFDGTNVHHYNGVYDPLNCVALSSTNLNKNYNGLTGFIPYKTILCEDKLDFVYGSGDVPEVAVFDNGINGYVFRFDYAADEVINLGNGKYLFMNRGGNYLAVLDTNKIPEGFTGGYVEKYYGTVTQPSDGVKRLNHYEKYNLSATDDKYIYLINDQTRRLSVYDNKTLTEVYSEKLPLTPYCVDADGTTLAIGFMEGKQLWIYDTEDWTHKIFNTVDSVYAVAIYMDNVVYASSFISYHCYLKMYNMTNEEYVSEGVFGSYTLFFEPTFAINRADGILYVGEISTLVYVDLKICEIIYRSPSSHFSYEVNPVMFDGEFVHYYGLTFHKLTAAENSATSVARPYDLPGYVQVFTFYDDCTTSVLRARKDSIDYIVFYDLKTNTFLYEIEAKATRVVYSNGVYVLLNNLTSEATVISAFN